MKIRPLLPRRPVHVDSPPVGSISLMHSLRSRLMEVHRPILKGNWIGKNHSLFVYLRYKLRSKFRDLFHPDLDSTHYAVLAGSARLLLDIVDPPLETLVETIKGLGGVVKFLERKILPA